MKTLLTLFLVLIFFGNAFSQVGIGTTSPNAQLDISASNTATPSNTDGLLIPKIDEFPATAPTTAQDGMLVFVTGNGAPTKGFYYWNQGTPAWVPLGGGGGSEWVDNGNYLVPADGNAEDVTIGGADNVNAKLTVRSDKAIGAYIDAQSVEDTRLVGIQSNIINSSTVPMAETFGFAQELTSANDGVLVGTTSGLTNTGNAVLVGAANGLSSDGTGEQIGTINDIYGSGTGFIRGTVNELGVNSDAFQIGTENNLSEGGEGIRTGTANNLFGSANGPEYGTNTSITTAGTTNSTHYGSSVSMAGSGNGERFGYSASFQGTGNGNRYGNEITMSTGGNGLHYGSYHLLSGTGTGTKYGSYSFIPPSAGGTHYGIFSEATKAGGFAGYFLGRLSIGSAAANNYILPASRGVNGQIMQTDGSGNVSWVTPAPSAASEWTDNGAYLTPLDGATKDVNIGGNYSGARLSVNSDKSLAIGVRNNSVQNTLMSGLDVNLTNNSASSSSITIGTRNSIVNQGSGLVYGVGNLLTASEASTVIGDYSYIDGVSSGSQTGNSVLIVNSGDGLHTGFSATLNGNGNGVQIGSGVTLNGTGSGFHIGTGINLYGTGNGFKVGTETNINSTGNGGHYGSRVSISSSGSGIHFGSSTTLAGASEGAQFGNSNFINVSGNDEHKTVNNAINSTGDGDHYGIHNILRGSGTGAKYGSYNSILSSAGGTHYGLYSEVLKPGSFAGYFLGNVSIGTSNFNTYTFPAFRGTNGQVMQTDASGNLSWISPTSLGGWSLSGNAGTNPATQFLGTTDAASIKFRTNNVERMEISETGKLEFLGINGNIMIGLGGAFSTGNGGGSNIFIGAFAGGAAMTTGGWNIGMGEGSLGGNISGQYNVSLGNYTLRNNTSGHNNIASGRFALNGNTTGNHNLVMGEYALQNNTTGSTNIALGYQVGQSTQTIGANIPDNNIIIGNDIDFPDGSGSNQLNVGNLLYGVDLDGTNNTISTGNLGIAVQTPTSKLHIAGDIQNDDASGNNWRRFIDIALDYNFAYNGALKSYIQDTDGSYNVFSDRKLKKNITSISTTISEKVMQLKPVNYSYSSDKTNTLQHGFIAQEVQELFPELVNEKETENGTFLSLNYQAFGVLAIKTIQDQQQEIDILQAKVSALQELEKRIEKLEMN